MRVIDYRGAIEELLFSERGAYLAGTDHGGPERTGSASVNVWEVATGRVRTLRGAGATSSVAFSPREHYVAVGTLDGAVHIGELTGGRWRSLRVGGIRTALALSGDERLLATGDGDFARVWDVATGEGLAELAHEQAVYRLVFSPDNRYLASVSEADGTDFGMDEDSFVVRVFLLRPEDLRAEACSRLATLEPALGGWVAAMRAPQRLCTGVPQPRAVIPGAAPP
jgi:WD40 repeat protein